MSTIKVKVIPPLKTKTYSEKKHGIVSRTQEEAKKSIFIKITMEGHGYALSKQLANDMMAFLKIIDSSASFLSEKTWGTKIYYDPELRTYIDTIVLDRDFDRTKQQQTEVVEYCRSKARELKKKRYKCLVA